MLPHTFHPDSPVVCGRVRRRRTPAARSPPPRARACDRGPTTRSLAMTRAPSLTSLLHSETAGKSSWKERAGNGVCQDSYKKVQHSAIVTPPQPSTIGDDHTPLSRVRRRRPEADISVFSGSPWEQTTIIWIERKRGDPRPLTAIIDQVDPAPILKEPPKGFEKCFNLTEHSPRFARHSRVEHEQERVDGEFRIPCREFFVLTRKTKPGHALDLLPVHDRRNRGRRA